MDPLKHFPSKEGCSSSESGWTRYLASPMQDDFECSEDNYNKYSIKDDDDNDGDDGEGNSDDSMVSDASSAPSHHQYKHDEGDYAGKHSSRKEGKKEAKKSVKNSGKSKRRLGGQAKSGK
ncbi:PREDICTED: uncharacterized protein LOC18601823 isoform X2 [Theobroma cacao]|uniref:Uncharacterized protein LOC18601823 isoform X2 n=1 Tax=Theobroma cacao TaxID=3641 RepID=A0AB32W4I4_THECC|nr:PREDICTED: uncharacterized protein LOC18601823 isoform X2 [Theobroma cacao]